MAENEPDEDPKFPQDARLDSLDERLRQAQAKEAARTGAGDGVKDNVAYYRSPTYRALSVLIGYPLGTALIGFAIDRFAGTRGVWVAMVFVGFAVAMWEIWKLSKQGPNDGREG